MGQRRAYQVAEKIRAVVASELLRAKDPRFMLVTVTNVVLSPDLKHAKIYWNVTNKDQRLEDVERAFESAAGHFKRMVAKELALRFVPDLKFFYDNTLDEIEHVQKLLARVQQGSEN